MTNSITTKDIEAQVRALNELTGSPVDQYTRTGRSEVKANEGNFHLQWAYGGVKLCRNVKGGGSVDISRDGYGTKRQVYTFMQAYMSGIQAEREHAATKEVAS